MKVTYHIEGMHCGSCIEKITSALSPHIKVLALTFNPPVLKIEADILPSLGQLNTYLSTVGNYQLHPMTSELPKELPNTINEEGTEGLWSYYPIFLIASYIVSVALINNFDQEGFHWLGWMDQFMAGFFLVFSAFKFLNIYGFADGYASYDLLARRYHSYGLIYPFLELGLGLLYLGAWFPVTTAWLTIIIMGFSSLGVINSLRKKQKIRCACLGTILKVPLSSITLIEDLAMVILAAIAIVMR